MRRTLTLMLVAFALSMVAPPAHATTDPGLQYQWDLSVIGAQKAWQTAKGGGIVIAVVDTGLDLHHEDLASKLVPGYDFIDNDGTPQDAEGHGSHVAGIAAAITGNGRGIGSIAPGAKIMPIRVLDQNGEGSSSDVSAGVRWAADHGADVINLSLGEFGGSLFGSGFADALNYAWDHGAICVVASGNSFLYSSGIQDEPAIVVSATDRHDNEASYSSGVGSARWGLAAPGGDGGSRDDMVLSADIGNGYAYRYGTSQAAPHVSGAAALLRSLGLSPSQTVQRLLSTAKDLGPAGHDSTFGSGRLDVARAVAGLGASVPAPAPRPTTPRAQPRQTTASVPTATTNPAASEAPAASPTAAVPTQAPATPAQLSPASPSPVTPIAPLPQPLHALPGALSSPTSPRAPTTAAAGALVLLTAFGVGRQLLRRRVSSG
jgi:subtilisin family serine protease